MIAVEILQKQAERIAALGLLIRALDDDEHRIRVIQGLVEQELISPQAGDLLLDEYVVSA